MADQDTPNPASNKHKAEGEREASRPASKAAAEVTDRYDERTGGETGITNRPLDEAKASQEAIPERGNRKAEGRGAKRDS